MANEKIKELLKAIQADPKANETLREIIKAEGEDGIVRYLMEAAKKSGFTVTEAEIREAFEAEAKARMKKTEEAAADIQALPDDALVKAAGGKKGHSNCKDTFLDKENCWYNDGCDKNYQDYDDYVCHNNYKDQHCGNMGTWCDYMFFCENISYDGSEICVHGYIHG
ncbi:MAG: hypothetical protein IK099_10580 [Clostridia bacterium]|nr:hypothetical protein [Clostridia bacterium]